MTAQTLDQPRVVQSSAQLAGWSTIVGGVVTIILGFPLAQFQAQESPPWWIPTLNAASHLLILVGILGLARIGATGRGWLATSGVGLSVLGFAVLTVAEFSWMTGQGTSDALYSVASLAMMVGLIILGIAVLGAGRWGGWHRFIPLACGLHIPLVMGPAFALPGYAANYAIGLWGVWWLLLGVSQLADDVRRDG